MVNENEGGIVVTAPKELPVPNFNKQEVESIAVDAVNTAIAEGKINVPVGTKLYSHTIQFAPSHSSGDGKFNTFPFHVISSRETPYILNELEIDVGNRAISMSDDNSVLGSEIYYVSSNGSIVCIDALGDAIEFENVTDYTDTVTEL